MTQWREGYLCTNFLKKKKTGHAHTKQNGASYLTSYTRESLQRSWVY